MVLVDVEIDVLPEHPIVEFLGMTPHRRQGGGAVGQCMLQGIPYHLLHRRDHVGVEAAAGDDAPQRQRRGGVGLPAVAEILDEMQPALLPGEPAFVDADAEVGRAGCQAGHDLGKHDLLDPRRVGVEQ